MNANNIPKIFGAWFVFIVLFQLTMLGFVGWVVVKLLQHFQVI